MKGLTIIRPFLLVASLVLANASSSLALEICHFTQIDGGAPNCGLRLDGTVYCWGQGTSDPHFVVPGGTFTYVDAGSGNACGLRADGSAECWGRICAPYAYLNYVYWVCGGIAVPDGEFTDISINYTEACGVRPDGSAICFGGNPGANASNVPAEPFTSIEAGFMHACGIDQSGDVECWGYNQWGNTDEPEPDGVHSFSGLVSGGAHNCALRNGAAECWGYNNHGETDVLGGTFVELSSGMEATCGLRADGGVECWGWNDRGQASPPPGPFEHISGTCGLRADGSAECWGPGAGVVECAVCGNGILGGTEICDDGNLVDGDGCDSNCTPTACGNGVVSPGEECDDGNLVDYDGCDADCLFTHPECGNGATENAEDCDDGNLDEADRCLNDCTWAPDVCGDLVIQVHEQCDDGNVMDDDGCDSNCWISGPQCGNGVLTSDEECDDGNSDAGDGCDENCLQECPLTSTMDGVTFIAPERSSVTLRDDNDDRRDSLKWKWSGVLEQSLPEFPYARFQVCIYPDAGVLSGAVRLRGPSGWNDDRFYDTYSNPLALNGGLRTLKIKQRSTFKISLKALGAALPDEILPASSSLTIALCEMTSKVCWISPFGNGRLEPGSYKAKLSN